MAQQGLQLDEEKFYCPICLDLLKDPVTTSCGHSYCRSCIKHHWDGEDQVGVHSCPQCRQTFISRPVLGKNTMLAELVEELKKTGSQAAPYHQHYAEPGDVACDVCTGRKLKATQSCLQCVASYCELHLQPHYESQTFQKHKLVEASAKLQENICSHHNKVKEVFCRSDQQCICYLCAMDEHKDHDTVSTAAERTERQKDLGPRWQNIQQRLQDKEKDVKLLQQQVEAISGSADKAVRDSQTLFTQLVQLVEKQSSDVEQQIRSQQEREVKRVKELQKKLQQEITELTRKDAELEQLSRTEEHSQFLLSYPSLSALGELSYLASISIHPVSYFEEVTAAVSALTKRLQLILSEDWASILLTEREASLRPEESKALLKQPQHLVQPPSFQAQQESRTLVYQQQHLVLLPPSFHQPEESKTSVNQQPWLVLPPPPFQLPKESKTSVKQQLHLVLPSPSFQQQVQSKIVGTQQPGLVPPTSLHKFEDSKASLKQHPGLVTPPSFQQPEEPKTSMKQPQLVLASPSFQLPAQSKISGKQQSGLLPLTSLQKPEKPKTSFKQHLGLVPLSSSFQATEESKTSVNQQPCLVLPPPPFQPQPDSKTSVKQQPGLVTPTPLEKLEESRTSLKQHPGLVPPSSSFQAPEESKTSVKQQPGLVTPTSSFQAPEESKTSVKPQLGLVTQTFLEKLEESKNSMKHQPHLVLPPPYFQLPAQSRVPVKQQSGLVPPTSLQKPEKPKISVKQPPGLASPSPLLQPQQELKTSVKQQPHLEPPSPSFQPPGEPKTRAEFLQYSQRITLDPNTVNKGLELSERNRKVSWMNKVQSYPDHPDRFRDSFQVLSRESLSGRCYWEVKRSRSVSVAVAYKSISRTGSESVFGDNEQSWMTYCCLNSYEFKHNSVITFLSGPRSSTVGVYLDHSAGFLSFYSVAETMTLLHRVQTTFAQPLHAGLWVGFGSSAELVELQ